MGGAAVPLLEAGERDAVSIFRYVIRYFVARSLWSMTHPPAARLPRIQSYAWQEGHQIILQNRGHFVNRGGRWERVVGPSGPA
jgi:hypothetical protein